ncbi:MAG: sodium transporter, partial [Myxococcota bacterium]
MSDASALAPLDIAVLIAYLVGSVGLGLFLSRRQSSSEDYFLAGRGMAWWTVGLSLFASNISSTTLIGLAGEGYAHGIAVFNYEWMAAVVLGFFVIYMLPTVLSARVFTMPELLERRCSRGARRYFSALTLLLNILVDTAGSRYAGGL